MYLLYHEHSEVYRGLCNKESKRAIARSLNRAPSTFCDSGKPWQKGSIENFNGMLRYRIPFNIPPEEITQKLLDSVAYDLNHMPRESLNF